MISVRIWSFLVLVFPWSDWIRRESVSLCIQSECVKIRTRTTPNTGNFHAMVSPVSKFWFTVNISTGTISTETHSGLPQTSNTECFAWLKVVSCWLKALHLDVCGSLGDSWLCSSVVDFERFLACFPGETKDYNKRK